MRHARERRFAGGPKPVSVILRAVEQISTNGHIHQPVARATGQGAKARGTGRKPPIELPVARKIALLPKTGRHSMIVRRSRIDLRSKHGRINNHDPQDSRIVPLRTEAAP